MMKSIRRLFLPAFIVVAGVIALWPFVDQSATRVSLCVTGLGLILAWYSILDLREQRKERFWPHTIDRLATATFTAITLVLVVNLVVKPPDPPVDRPLPLRAQATFDSAVLELAKNGTLDQSHLQTVVHEHFGQFRGADGSLTLACPDKKRFLLTGRGSGIIVTVQ